MNNKSKSLHFWGAVFVIILGSLLHFVYQWSNDNFLVGLIAPINESVWEHMKLSFTPMLIFGFYEYFTYFKNHAKNYWLAHIIEQLFVILFIITFFYTYQLFINESLFLDILSFIIGVMLAKYISFEIIKSKLNFQYQKIISITLLILLGVFFIYATINPPKTSLFYDSVTGTYGIYKQQ